MSFEICPGEADDNPVAIAIMGPTASGKTDLALTIADAIPSEIISVDSALVYKGMDIGTAKPSHEELARAPHHLIDIMEPEEAYSAASFRHDALGLMRDIQQRGKLPVLAGGTMLYFRALQQGLSELPSANPEVREKLEQEAAQHGWAYMHDRLSQVDAASAEKIHPNDPQRIQRALEIYEITGEAMSSHWARQQQQKLPWRLIKLVLLPDDRAVLHDRIERRFNHMVETGLIEEVEALKRRGTLNLDMPSMRAVGYRQVWEYLDGLYGKQEMIAKGIYATRQLAKRQITWLRKESYCNQLSVESVKSVEIMQNLQKTLS